MTAIGSKVWIAFAHRLSMPIEYFFRERALTFLSFS